MTVKKIRVRPRRSINVETAEGHQTMKSTTENINDHDIFIRTKLVNLLRTSTVHGIARIITTGSRIRRFLWVAFFMLTFGYLLYQIYTVFQNYYAHHIKTTLDLEFRPLMFPAVTVCNLNPIRKSMIPVYGSPFMKMLAEMEKEDIVGNENITYRNVSNITMDDVNNELKNRFMQFVYDNAAFEAKDEDDDLFLILSEQHANISERSFDGGTYTSTLDENYLMKQAILMEYQRLSRGAKEQLGHQLHQMVLRCSFAGRSCYMPTNSHVNSDYGNCYTFQSSKYVATKSGPDYGMEMVINLENHEVLRAINKAYGARLLIHQPGSFPIPAEEGITISSGYETSLGIKMKRINRLGQPYGSCKDPALFQVQNGSRYTTQICLLACKETLVQNECGCFYSNIKTEMKPDSELKERALPHCTESETDFLCMFKVIRSLLIENTGKCNCPNPCNETVYAKIFSGRIWPNQYYFDELMEDACRKYNDSKGCPLRNLPQDASVHNFLKINIYYEDLNFESITEQPLYDKSALLSDLGGSMGLFLGASILSAYEVFDILVMLCLSLIKRCRNKNFQD